MTTEKILITLVKHEADLLAALEALENMTNRPEVERAMLNAGYIAEYHTVKRAAIKEAKGEITP